MALDDRYFVTSDLSPYFVDKNTGLPLSNGSISFYRDVARNTPKTVYQLIGAPPNYGYIPLPNPVPLSAVGTPQDGNGNDVIIYYFPYDVDGNIDLYYAVVADSAATMNQTVEAWPNVIADSSPTQNDFSISNQVSNAQFTQTFLNGNAPTIYSVTAASNQVFSFSPNWDFVISGTGSVTVQRIAIPGNDKVITSPPYSLDIAISGGITACYLRQRFNKNSGLWASTTTQSIFLAGSVIAINQLAGNSSVEMFYVESTGGSPISILQGTFDNSGYKLLTGVTALPIPLSTNTDVGEDGYIDIYLSFLPNSHIRLSSVQVVPSFNQDSASLISFQLNSSNREQAFMGDYYIPRLNKRTSESIAQGWDFTVNPFQFSVSGIINMTTAYICDQTIARVGSTAPVSFLRDSVTKGLKFITSGPNDSFYIMQYLSGSDAKKIIGTPLSVNVFGYVTSLSDPVTMKVYLCRAPSTASIPILPTSIGNVDVLGTLNLTAAGWTEIPRSGLNTASSTLPVVTTNPNINNDENDMGFTGWELIDSTQINDTEHFAIIVTFAYVAPATEITINSISLIPNEIPCRPAIKSYAEVLQECQYYYEKSYDIGIYGGASSINGALAFKQTANRTTLINIDSFPLHIWCRYIVTKRISIVPTIYSLIGTLNNISVEIFDLNTQAGISDAPIAGNFTFSNNGCNGFQLQPVSLGNILTSTSVPSSTNQNIEATAKFHIIADARLGIV